MQLQAQVSPQLEPAPAVSTSAATRELSLLLASSPRSTSSRTTAPHPSCTYTCILLTIFGERNIVDIY